MFAMLFLKNAAGALRRTLTDTAHHVFSGPHRGWKIALYVAMLVLPGGSLAALGFAWFDHRRQRNAKGASRRTPERAATEPPS
ncbi:multidrug ABC transporter ATPase, partial [Burkholderia multivorans]